MTYRQSTIASFVIQHQIVSVAIFETTTPLEAIINKTQSHNVEYFNLDVIISFGYIVKSKRVAEFSKWANKILK